MSSSGPEMMGYSPRVVSMDSGSHILRIPAESPLAILKPLGAKRAMVVGWVWPVYSLQSEGSSMDRTKMDLPDYIAPSPSQQLSSLK